MKNYRHGDLALIGIKELPKNLNESTSKELMRGSNNNAHSFKNGEFFPKKVNQFIFGYFVAKKGCVLLHKEHGLSVKNKNLKESKVVSGVYELRVQHEDTNNGMKQVID